MKSLSPSRFVALASLLFSFPVAAQQFSALPAPELPENQTPLADSLAASPFDASPSIWRGLRTSRPALRARTVPLPTLPASFGQTPTEIYPFLRDLAASEPARVRLKNYGKSVRGQSLVAVEVRPAVLPKKGLKRLVVICRQHGNEPEATASGNRFLKGFLRPQTDLQRRIAARTVLLLVPIANPDGAAIYERRNAQNVDMNRDWNRRRSPEVRALVSLVAAWKPHLVVDNHQWLPSHRQPAPMAEASGGARARSAARLASRHNAQRGYSLAARNSRSGASNDLCHRFWGTRAKIPAILIETRHNPGVSGAREKAINQAVAALWGAAESLN